MSRSTAISQILKGKTLGNRYMLGEVIGKGAYGWVYDGLDLENGDFVAIKRVPLEYIPEEDLNNIMKEIDLLKDVNHKNIAKYRGSLKTMSHLHIILEYADRGMLSNMIKPNKFGPFPELLVAVYIAQVLEGLVYLHEQGVIHRDIKGANIFITKEGLVKLADFGVAAKLDKANLNAHLVGPLYWMAPEVIQMSGVCAASDLWSVGCTVIELLTCVPPYHDLQPMPALFRIVQDLQPPIPPGLSTGITDFLCQCFKKDPMQRPAAKTLLLHPWIQNTRLVLQSLSQAGGSLRNTYEGATVAFGTSPDDDRVGDENPPREETNGTASEVEQVVITSVGTGANELSRFSDPPGDASLDDLFQPLDKVSGDQGAEASTSATSQGDIILFCGGKNNLINELEARIAQTQLENESEQRNYEMLPGVARDALNENVFDENLQCQNIAHLQPNQSGSRGPEPCCHSKDSEEKISEGGQAEPRDESRISNLRDKWSSLEVLYSDIKVATNNLCELSEVGKGGYGIVYKGKLGGKMMAIKILDSTSKQGPQEFFQELEVLYGMQHPNLVRLAGACFEVHALVYEFLPNGSLEDCLKYTPNLLTWQMRTRIICEICSALTYLHSKSVVHGDLKPANILLDANFKSKLSDFGLCRLLPEDMTTAAYLETVPKGTSGYIDPWFLETWILRPGSDLYSFGITILKLLTGMKPVGLGVKVRDADENSLRKMIDPTAGSWPFVMAKELAYWSLQCCYHNEKSSKLLEDMSTCLEDMLAEIETLEDGRFKM